MDDNLIKATDKNDNETKYVYSARNLLVRTTDALGGVIVGRYDRVNNLVEHIDELRRSTVSEYDELSRVVRLTSPDPDGPTLPGTEGLSAEYLFQGTRNEESGGTTLDLFNAAGQFVSENVMGTTRQAFQFTQGNGLQLSTTGVIPTDHYSIELVFRLDNVSSFKRVLDFAGLSTDNGLYLNSGRAATLQPCGQWRKRHGGPIRPRDPHARRKHRPTEGICGRCVGV